MEEEKIQSLEGTVETVVFRNQDNGYTVVHIDDGDNLVTVVGNMIEVNEGDRIKVAGTYSSHHNFGLQFKAISTEICLPEGTAAIEKYLSSGAIKGIGPGLAKKIVSTFGDKTLDIIEKQPEQLSQIKGISMQKALSIEEEFKKVFGMRTVIMFITQFDLPVSYGIRAWKQFGELTMDLIKENPFILCINSIGLQFDKAEKIRLHLNIDDNSDCRLCAGILYSLQKQQLDGHSCYPEELLLSETSTLLNVNIDLLKTTLYNLNQRESVYIEECSDKIRYVYLQEAYNAEQYIATRISLMIRSIPNLNIDWSKQIKQLEDSSGMQYASLQKEAISMALNNPIMVLTGGPGTGKTTTLNAIIELFKNEGNNVSIVAPTGRAAKRIGDLTGYEAKTIHRLLGVEYSEDNNRKFIHNEKKLLKCDVIVIDELSMVDTIIFENLLRALRISCRIVLVGDNDQLPPIGIGNVLKDIIDSECVPTVKLTEIFRQASKSLIVTNAHKIIDGKMPDLSSKNSDFFFIKSTNQENCIEKLIDVYIRRLPNAYGYSPITDIQILCPTRIGPLGTIEMNNRIQDKLNPFKGKENEIKFGNTIFRLGDKVIQTKNNYDIVWKKHNSTDDIVETGIFNGDIGTIIFIDKAAGGLKILFDDRVADYIFEQLGELDLAYAITVHKSQGSEFEAVILPLSSWTGRMCYRNLLYTAVTRAKNLMLIIGSDRAISEMVNNTLSTKKYTNLCEFIRRESIIGES